MKKAAPVDEDMPSQENETIAEQTHIKCRKGIYPGSTVDRAKVDDDKVSWKIEDPNYQPIEYTTQKIVEDKPVWADAHDNDEGYKDLKFNELNNGVNRVSFTGTYELIKYNGISRPRNPIGRTGISGRGLLGKWGPNHAADPIVTRWKRNEKGEIVKSTDVNNEKPILEFVSIQRRDNHEWAIPGGMVDNNEKVSLTLKREFGEEAMNSLEENERESTRKLIDDLFDGGDVIYKGYVDDPRNTDNSWMETVAVNFHDDNGTTVGKIPLQAGDDAKNVIWLSIDKELKLYASHFDFIQKACKLRGAYFP